MSEQSPTTTKHQLSAAELLSGIAATPEFGEAKKVYPFARARSHRLHSCWHVR